jgi:hypothetical protein
MSGLGEQFAKKDDRKLEDEILESFSFLFAEKNGVFVPNNPPKRYFDLAVATVAAEDLLFHFARMRGDFATSVTSSSHPDQWRELNEVLEDAEVREGLGTSEIVASRRSRSYANPESAGRVVRERWEQLKRYFKK